MVRIALFSDIHGKFLLPFRLVDKYQSLSGKKVHGILQCGDMGAFPDLSRLDKATLRHAEADRSELGFHDDFCNRNPEVQALLDRLNIPMICVRGNHEDHLFLDRLEAKSGEATRFPIDVYQRVWVCKSGIPQTLDGDGTTLHFVGIGRIGNRKGKDGNEFIQEFERKAIRKLHGSKARFDLAISHDQPLLVPHDFGMPELTDLLDHVPFPYLFHGHTGQPFSQNPFGNRGTVVVKIAEIEYSSSGLLPEGSMIILEKSKSGEITVEVIGKDVLLAGSKWG